MEFKCKCCERIVTANSFDDIVATGKLCNTCFSLDDYGRDKVKKAVYAKTHEFEKVDISRKKPFTGRDKKKYKKKHNFTFVCSCCGMDSNHSYKPYMCSNDGCNSRTFFRKEI